MNIVVIMTDTLRPDYVGGYQRASDAAPNLPGRLDVPVRTPNLDRFANAAAVFERAYAASFPTVPNRHDLHTGRYTFPHRGWSPLPPDLPVLAEAFGRAGYVSQFICDTPNQVPMGLHRGFGGWTWHRGQEGDRYVADPRIPVELPCPPEKLRGNGGAYRQYLRNRHHWRSEEDHFVAQTVRSGVAWLQQRYEAPRGEREQPFLLWLDTFDPHEPWDAPQHYVDWYDPGYDGEVIPHANYGRSDYLTPAELRHVQALYAAEVSMVDTWIGYLLDQIDRLDYCENTAVVHLSDHGHYFGDHGLQGKPFRDLLWFYEGLVRSACTIRHPGGLGRGARVEALLQPPDVTATLLELAGILAWRGVEGRSALSLVDGRSGRLHDQIYVSRYPILAGEVTPCQIVSDEWTSLYWPGSPEREELFHLPSDPGQMRNVLDEHRPLAAELRAAYLGWLRERTPDLADWLPQIERDSAFRPPAARLFSGML